ncbi:MAG: flavin reductase family protein [Planctomycetaceae bacterium]|nr:flavin reductase family protein [Planctomycetales bacterium]MCB9925260.1 flavin reductase family protein [Planctomycetaceae bacterium]
MPAARTNEIETVFSHIDREIWIVTASDDGRSGGLVATWVSQASIDAERPLVMIGIAPNHFTSELITASGGFGLHLITEDHIHHAWNFAIGSGRDRDKLAHVALAPVTARSPILAECLAWMDCRLFMAERTGDRVYYWADVINGGTTGGGSPLKESQLFRLATEEQKLQLRAGRDADIAIQRPRQLAWRATLSQPFEER